MSASSPEQAKKLPEKDVDCDEIVEVVELPPQDTVREVVETAFINAKRKIARYRANKIRENMVKAALTQEGDTDEDRGGDRRDEAMGTSHQNTVEERAARAAHVVPNCDRRPIRMKKVHVPPPGLAWVRVQSNVSIPEKYEHDFHVPYLGESDAKIKSSNTLAMDLFQQDLDDEGNDSEIEEYSDYVLNQDDDLFDTDDKSDKKSDSAKKETRSSRGKGQSPAKKTVQKKRRKHSVPVWDRAVKRVALKEVMDRLDIESTESIEDIVCDVFRVRYPYQVAAYFANVRTRIKLWKKHDEEELGKLERHAEVVNHARREMTTSPTEVLKSESITFFVCRQCYTYVCSLHGYQNDARPIKKPIDKSKKAALTPQTAAEIETKCEDRESAKCWCTMANPVDELEWSEKVKANLHLWSDVQAVLRELFETFGHDPCRTSSMLRSFLPQVHSEVHFTCCRVGYLCEQLFSQDRDSKKVLGRINSRPRKPQSKWSKSKVRRPAQEIESMQGGKRLDYVPCRHEGPCSMKSCMCMQNGLLCEKFCGCNHSHIQHSKSQVTCNNAYRGCACKSSAACASKACLCFSMNRECDPDLCRQCHDSKEGSLPNGKKWGCLNEGLRMNEKHRTVVGHSKVHGWGVFAVSDIPKSDIIGEYVGELIKQEEAERRGRVYDEINYSFLFNTTKDYALDSTRLGNKLRYCNHSSRPNCEPKVMRVGGDVRVGLYAKRNIAKNEELFFNYGYNDGPAWAMSGQTKGGSTSKKRSSVTGKRKPSSDGDSDEVLPVSSRQRKSLRQELSVTGDLEAGKASLTNVTRSQRRRKPNEDDYVSVAVYVSDDEVVPVDAPEGEIATDPERDETKHPKGTSRRQNLTPLAPGLSIWRGILKRVAVGAADVESPGRRLPNRSSGRDTLQDVPEWTVALQRIQSSEHRKRDDGERRHAVLGKGSASRRRADEWNRAMTSSGRDAVHGDGGQRPDRGEEKAQSEGRSSREANGPREVACSKSVMASYEASRNDNERRSIADEDEGEATLKEVFGSDYEVESDVPSRNSPDAKDVRVPEIPSNQKNGIRSGSRSPSSDDGCASDDEYPTGEPDGYGTSQLEAFDDNPVTGKETSENPIPADGDEGFRKRRHPSTLAAGKSSKHSDYADRKRDALIVSKRPRLVGNAPMKVSEHPDGNDVGSVHNIRASLSKINGSMTRADDREDTSPAKRRLFPSNKRPHSAEHDFASPPDRGSVTGPHVSNQSQSSSARKRRELRENCPASSTDEDGTEESVPVVNLISDEDDDDGEHNGTLEPNFSNWFM